jgi:homogentisate phytyltransferase/homogentisate geranylgeranyltransferase
LIQLGYKVPTNIVAACKSYPQSLIATVFFAIFGFVIALMKDVPDVLGDKKYNIRSLSVKLGASFIFSLSWISLFVLLLGTSTLNVAQLFLCRKVVDNVSILSRSFVSVGLLSCAADVKRRAKHVNSTVPSQVYDYYLHIWNIFYFCYLLLPFVK